MNQAATQEKQISEQRMVILEKKASFLEDILAFIEDKALGFLMEKTEGEKNIPLSQAKKLCQ